jgi:FAD/FMN-containing dehydrogenase
LGRPEYSTEFVIQDVEIPFAHCKEFFAFYAENIDIRPMWICPMVPQKDARKWTLYKMNPGKLHLNFGFWHTVPVPPGTPAGFVNRKLERKVAALKGRKSLYSDCYYPEDEFWEIYNGPEYSKLKNQFDPDGRFLNLYQKAVGGR